MFSFPSSNVLFAHFCRENGIYALWWAGFARHTSMVGRLDDSGAGGSDKKGSTKKARESTCTKEVEATGPGTPRPLPFVLSSQNTVEFSHCSLSALIEKASLRSLQCSGDKLKREVRCILCSPKVCLIVFQN